ncbi:MAG: hypothetical protein AAF621_03970 [Pseudomonadota bacterium]
MNQYPLLETELDSLSLDTTLSSICFSLFTACAALIHGYYRQNPENYSFFEEPLVAFGIMFLGIGLYRLIRGRNLLKEIKKSAYPIENPTLPTINLVTPSKSNDAGR